MWSVLPDMYNAFRDPHIQASIFNSTYLRCYSRYLDNSKRVLLQTRCQIQRISSSLRHVSCGPVHIQTNCCYAYLGFNIQLNVSALLLEISRQFNARYTANLMRNIAHISQFNLCELRYTRYTMQLQFRIISLHHSTERICAAIVDMPTFGCALYCKFGAISGAHQPVYAMWTVFPVT
jgi:hypothetical protein